MQMPDRPRHIALLYDKADVNFRTALGNHADVYPSLGDSIEDACRDAGLSVDVLSHQTDDRLTVFAGHIGNLLKLGEQSLWQPLGLHSERETDLRYGDNVHRARM